ncbi:Small-conductance mechanosensitive channel [Filomicrobium insigne]|uniref:Small-conductance mechanosensitive channel n=1 Tax=Filomicrobium insigne TaxID=418854 RepID=A0A1H0TBH4_9HYPH|nr:DUF3772 domain-containing protein [Filomicrobium insigne]SDP51392.1 Small-conductance mechanosensitive channel [Filomicrobium insigne]
MFADIRRLGLYVILALVGMGALPLAAQTPTAPPATPPSATGEPAPAGAPPARRTQWPSEKFAQQPDEAKKAEGKAEKSATSAQTKTEPSTNTPTADGTPAAAPAPTNGNGQATNGDARPAASSEKSSESEAPANTVAPTPTELPADITNGLNQAQGLESRIEALEKSVERVKGRDKELIDQLPVIEAVIADSQRLARELRPKLDDVRSQISRLGPAPDGKDIPPESATIAAQRSRLNAIAAAIDGAIKTAGLVEVRARQLSGRVQELRQDIFTRDLLRRSRSPLAPAFWEEIWRAVPSAKLQVQAITAGWWSNVLIQLPATIAVILGSFAFYAVLKLLMLRLLRGLSASQIADPGFYLKVSMAGAQAPLRAIPAIAGASALYFGLDFLGLLYLQVGYLAATILEGVIIYKVSTALARAYLRPNQPAWRVLEFDNQTARRLARLIKLIAAVYVIDLALRELIRLLYLPLPFSIVTTLTASLLLAVLFALVSRMRFPLSVDNDSSLARLRAELIRLPLLLAAVVIVVALVGGYIALARYVGNQVLMTGSAIILLLLFYLANRAIAAEPDQNPGAQAAAADPHGLSIDLRRRMAGITAVVLDSILVVVGIPVLLLSFGFSTADIGSLANRALFGFEIGGVQISLARIAIALGIFAVLLTLTRVLQRWLSETVLHPRRTDQGLSNSISTGVNYLGIGVASLAAISYAGLDITNIALVAGALSVGIGFGLQSIVNNFVSGLILLVERPIKVGDWIDVAGQGGYVRRISVRATEIETFDRASVILPNSELITGTVINYTHRNAMGRLTIPVRVNYGADPEHVISVLMDIAENSSLVAKHPAPFVAFENFGDNALEFSLRVYIIDVGKTLGTKTELRTQIVKRFAEEGIGFPFPQRDIHLRDLDGLKIVLAKLLQNRASAQQVKSDSEDEAPQT